MQNITETIFFGNIQDDGQGCGVFTILNSVVDILSIGIGILAIIGITIVGIKYLTAKGNIEQTKKAKHRLLQIVIGLVTYILLYAGIQFLLPGGHLNSNQNCTTISDQELATLKEQEKAEKEKNKTSGGTGSNTDSSQGVANASSDYKNSSAYKYCMKNAAKVVKNAGICNYDTAAKRVIATAKLFAWPSGTKKKKYQYDGGSPKKEYKSARNEVLKGKANWNNKTRKGASCLVFTSTVVRGAGIDSKYPPGENQYSYKSSKFERITCKNCVPYNKSRPGDIILYYDKKWGGSGHALIRGDGVIYEAQYHAGTYPHTSSMSKIKKKKAAVVVLRPKD